MSSGMSSSQEPEKDEAEKAIEIWKVKKVSRRTHAVCVM